MEIISVTNLIKKYGEFQAVNGINFSVEQGEVFDSWVPTGQGKLLPSI